MAGTERKVGVCAAMFAEWRAAATTAVAAARRRRSCCTAGQQPRPKRSVLRRPAVWRRLAPRPVLREACKSAEQADCGYVLRAEHMYCLVQVQIKGLIQRVVLHGILGRSK